MVCCLQLPTVGGVEPPGVQVLPDQAEQLRETLAKSKKTYIVKPQDGSQGDGISSCLRQVSPLCQPSTLDGDCSNDDGGDDGGGDDDYDGDDDDDDDDEEEEEEEEQGCHLRCISF